MAEICAIIIGILGLADAPVKIKQYVLDPIKTQFRYLFRHIIIIQNLRGQRERLNAKRGRLQDDIRAFERNNWIINADVDEWLVKVGNLEGEITRILNHEPQDGTCLKGTCPNLKVRYSHSRKAMELIPKIDELIDQCDNFGNNICHPLVTGIPMTYESDIVQFDSRKEIEEKIMSYLSDQSPCMIGVCGVGGLGKTTMATKIAERAMKDNLFHEIAMADVTQEVNQLKIQQQLAAGLKLDLTEDVVNVRAVELQTRLMNKNVLIILDDVWERLNIAELGIPPQIKILITTRDTHVCEKMSTAERPAVILTLGFLNEAEAFSLFRDKTGAVVDQPNLLPIAKDVAKECKGLPLALAIFGAALKGGNREYIWKSFLSQLRKPAPTNIDADVKDLYRRLELSYDCLEREDKDLLLLCCLFPKDSYIEIEDLVRCGVGLLNFAATEARDKVICIVRRLVHRCLLMSADDESCPTSVKMHDVIHDMALLIASRDEHKFKVSHDKALTVWPHESYTCISLTLGEVMIFPELMHCPGLKALLLTIDLWATTQMLPENFFNGMVDLILLRIHGEGWFRELRLPLSFFSSLTKLRVLLLHKCGFEDTDISFLGRLKNLEILSCRECDIQRLPNEIKELRKLKLLDMTDCKELKNIAPGVVSELVLLEELRFMGCPIEWEPPETEDERRNASLAEVFSLKYLWFLGIWIQDLKAISQEMDYPPKLKSYSISIGPDPDPFFKEGSYGDLKRMSVSVDETMVFPDAISTLIKDAKELKLEGKAVEVIIEFPSIESLDIRKVSSNFKIFGNLQLADKVMSSSPPNPFLSHFFIKRTIEIYGKYNY